MSVTVPAPTAPRRRHLRWWSLAIGVLISVVAIVAAFGGFRDVPIQKLPEIELGESFTGTEVTTIVKAVRLSDHAPGTGYDATEGSRYLVVDVTAVNNTSEPNLLASRLVRVLLEGVVTPDDDDQFRGAIDPRTGDPIVYLQPSLPTAMAFAWMIPADSAFVGQEIIVGVFQRQRVYGDPVFGDDAFTTTPAIRVKTRITGI